MGLVIAHSFTYALSLYNKTLRVSLTSYFPNLSRGALHQYLLTCLFPYGLHCDSSEIAILFTHLSVGSKASRMPLIPSSPRDRIILGLMTFGPDVEVGARITDVNEFRRCLDRFQERGYNEVDTARVYAAGKQEAFTRESGWKERGLTLATKFKYPGADGDNVPAKIAESLETSLAELGTDCVDVS